MSQKTSLYKEHVKLGAVIVDFAGWDMPVRYKSIKEEVMAVRESAGMFDVSHMGEFFFTGADANKVIDYVMTNDFIGTPIGKAVYSPLCDKNGKMIDDAIGYRLTEGMALLCVNASNIDKDKKWIEKVIAEKNFSCEFKDLSDNFSLIALQGPESEKKILQALDINLSELDYYSVTKHGDYIFARTGYTGEDGFEVFASHAAILKLWTRLIDLGVTPCGLAARDVLRLEVAYPLYGQDLTQELSPLDCNLKWTVKMNKTDFSGKDAIENYKSSKRLIKLQLDKGIPRTGHVIFQNDEQIGEVTSGTMSVINKKGICLAIVDRVKFDKEALHFLEIRGKKHQAQFTTKPFVIGGHK